MNKSTHRQIMDEVYRAVGLLLVALVGFGAINAVAFGLMGYLIDSALARMVVLLVVWVAIVFYMLGYKAGHHAGEQHVLGVERGIDLKLNAAARERTERAAAKMTNQRPRWEELLSTVDGKAAIVRRADSETGPIEM